MPPFRKKVTCAYFSVSAIHELPQLWSCQHLAKGVFDLLRQEGHSPWIVTSVVLSKAGEAGNLQAFRAL